MNPKTISEQMMYSTIRLRAKNGSTGTGFFFNFEFNGKSIAVIITNKHVINDNPKEEVTFFLHTKSVENITSFFHTKLVEKVAKEKIQITFSTNWFFHDSQDLCFCFAKPLFEQIKSQIKKDAFYISVGEEFIYDNTKLEKLSAVEDIIMVGYPNGLWDEKNNLPLFRRGITSSHPAIDFNRKNIGAVDMACFPGSSGSPIFILNENRYIGKIANSYSGAKRLIFLGVLFQGPQFKAKGELVVENVSTKQKISSQTPMMMNLGFYIKAMEILKFKEIIKRHYISMS
jgi:hypothetical protein